MTEPQIWAALGILAAALTGMITLTLSTLTTQLRAIGTRIDSVETTMGVRFESIETIMDTRFESIGSTMNARFDAVNTRIDALDRDVQALSVRVFGSDQA